MKSLTSFPGFEIFISEKNDGNFRQKIIFPEIKRPLKQVHGIELHEIIKENKDISFEGCDGTYTHEKGVTIGALCADCPIIILMGDDECAAVHSGWRGTRAHIVRFAVERFSTPSEKIRVYIGPHISRESYEVHQDFFEYFDEEYFTHKEGKVYFDITMPIIEDMINLGILKSPQNFSKIISNFPLTEGFLT